MYIQYLTKITYVSRVTRAICTACYRQDQFAKYCVFVGGTRAAPPTITQYRVGSRAHALFCACVIHENGCKFVANAPRIL